MRHYLNFLCELNFNGQQIFNVQHEQEIVQIFTHTKLTITNLTSLTSKLYCYNMFCKKQSVIIIIKNKQTNLLLKNWLRLHSGSGPSLKNQLQLHSCFRKLLRLRPESTPTLRLLYSFGLDAHAFFFTT